MDDTFDKQRRNLITTSMLLLLIQFAHITITDDIKTSLLSLKIGQPEIIMYFIYIVHLYLITRFINNRPVESYDIGTLYYHKRMLYLAKCILPYVLSCQESEKRHDETMSEMQREMSGMYDPFHDDYYQSLSPNIENQTKDILNHKKITHELIEKTANEIERYQNNMYRWQFQEGRFTEELNFLHEFSKLDVFTSYLVALYTTLLSEHFSKYQLPLVTSIPPVFLFAIYLFNLTH